MTDRPEDWPPLFPVVGLNTDYFYRGKDILNESRNGTIAPFPDWGVLMRS